MPVTLLGLQSRAGHTWVPFGDDDGAAVDELRTSIRNWIDVWLQGEPPEGSPAMQSVEAIVARYDVLHLSYANTKLDSMLNSGRDGVAP